MAAAGAPFDRVDPRGGVVRPARWHPGPRDRHLTREHVPLCRRAHGLSDDLASCPAIFEDTCETFDPFVTSKKFKYHSWKVIQGVVLKAYSASAAVMVCSNVSRGRR